MGTALNDGLSPSNAYLVTATGGDLAGHVYLVVLDSSNAAYDPGTDLVFDITGYSGTLDTGDFI